MAGMRRAVLPMGIMARSRDTVTGMAKAHTSTTTMANMATPTIRTKLVKIAYGDTMKSTLAISTFALFLTACSHGPHGSTNLPQKQRGATYGQERNLCAPGQNKYYCNHSYHEVRGVRGK